MGRGPGVGVRAGFYRVWGRAVPDPRRTLRSEVAESIMSRHRVRLARRPMRTDPDLLDTRLPRDRPRFPAGGRA